MPGARILKIVVMKLIAPRIDDAPARCTERMTKSIAGPGWPVLDESGGGKDQPPPQAPPPRPPSPHNQAEKHGEKGGHRPKRKGVFIEGGRVRAPAPHRT